MACLALVLSVAPAAGDDLATLEARMVDRVNQDRERHALSQLERSEALAAVAREHSRDMVEEGFFAHVSPRTGMLRDRLGRAGIRFARAGENIAQDLSLEGAAQSLLASPSHRVNILSSEYTHIGVGIVRKGAWLYVTQNFMRLPSPSREHRPEPEMPPVAVRAEFLGGALRGF